MPIAVSCPSCGASFRVKDELAGRRGKCPKCQGVLEIPRPQAAASSKPASSVKGISSAPPAAVEMKLPPRPSVQPAASVRHDAVPAARRTASGVRPSGAGQTMQPSSATLPIDLRQLVLSSFKGSINPVQESGVYRLAKIDGQRRR